MGEPLDRALVTIITPTLNQVRTLPSTLDSVRMQTYPRVQHIVIDGGSTDGTLDMLEVARARTGLDWISEADRGMYDALNKGIRLAAGSIVGYLNSDDLLLPWAVEVAVNELERTGADLVYGDALRLDERNDRVEPALQVRFARERVAVFGSLAQPAVFWRRSLHESCGEFSPDLQFVGDLDFWLRVARLTQPRHIEDVLAVFRTHPDAKTIRSRREMRAEEIRVREAHTRPGGPTLLRVVRARLSHGLQVRRQQLRFAAAMSAREPTRWLWFRAELRPTMSWLRFARALFPMAGRLWVNDYVRLPVRPWLGRQR
jgi:GT2 family glycosyltransferase